MLLKIEKYQKKSKRLYFYNISNTVSAFALLWCSSLDVTSLYTNITHDRGIEAISYWIDQYPSHLVEERFTKEFIIAGLTLVLKNNYFKFNGKM